MKYSSVDSKVCARCSLYLENACKGLLDWHWLDSSCPANQNKPKQRGRKIHT